MFYLVRVVLFVFGKGDKAGKGGNQRAESAEVYGRQKVGVIRREVGEQYRARHVADALAGKNAKEQRVFRKQVRKETADFRDAGKVSAEHEKGAEGAEQGVVYLRDCFFVKNEKHYRDGSRTQEARDDPEYNQNAADKENRVERGSSFWERERGIVVKRQRFGLYEKAGDKNERRCRGKRRQHDFHELYRVDSEIGIKVKILRIAKRRNHAAEVCCDILHDEDKSH